MFASETQSLSTPAAEESFPSPFQRAVLVFVRPGTAWAGLRERSQWWFPFLLVPIVNLLGAGLTYYRAQLPAMLEAMEERVANGEMSAEQLQAVERIYGGPTGMMITVGSVIVVMVLLTLLIGLLLWFTVGFVLGAPFRYRHALEVASWSSLVTLPSTVLTYVMAWFRGSMRGVHIGFGVLLPEAGSGDRLLRALGVFLDWIGPFGIWHVAVAVLGAAVLSGAPRKSVAWALGVLYLVSGLFAAALAALLPGGA